MPDTNFQRRREQLLDRLISGELEQSSYDALVAEIDRLEERARAEHKADVDSAPAPESLGTASSSTGDTDRGGGPGQPFQSVGAMPTFAPTLSRGARLGDYELQDRIGRGGMGEVWRARDTVGNRTVVVKTLPPELQGHAEEMARVEATFQRVHALQHQHICPTHQLGRDGRVGLYLVMKYIDGITLSEYRRRYVAQHGVFPVNGVARVLAPVAAALDYAHSQRVIHRDIKPHNILVKADGSDPQVVDFGLADEIRTSLTRVSQARMETSGTYPYMAPEQWQGRRQDARTDQYALAVVAYELLAGDLPFTAPDPLVLRGCVLSDPVPEMEGLPDAAMEVLRRGMAKAPAERFASCAEFVAALEGKAEVKPSPPPLAQAAADPAPGGSPPIFRPPVAGAPLGQPPVAEKDRLSPVEPSPSKKSSAIGPVLAIVFGVIIAVLAFVVIGGFLLSGPGDLEAPAHIEKRSYTEPNWDSNTHGSGRGDVPTAPGHKEKTLPPARPPGRKPPNPLDPTSDDLLDGLK